MIPPKHSVLLMGLGLVLISFLATGADAAKAKSGKKVKCVDCVGRNCLGQSCEGDYCLLAHYAPRWGSVEWGEPRVVKGCVTGKMVRNDVRDHCETADIDGEEVFTCFCRNKDYCNHDNAVRRLEVQPVPLLTCVCNGDHCKSPTCQGELCSYVINHKSGKREQGCVNASVPLVERRSQGACMMPPITGAMHHSVAKTAKELLFTESCVCGTDFCNQEKPKPKVKENMKCRAFVQVEAMGTNMASKNTTCEGEYCFKVEILSEIGHMSSYKTMGCASYMPTAPLAEEMNPTGCATFDSENVKVSACLLTDDKAAIGRARANQEVTEPVRKPQKGRPSRMELTYDDEEEQPEEEEEEESGIIRRKPAKARKPAKEPEAEPEAAEEEPEDDAEKEKEEEGDDKPESDTESDKEDDINLEATTPHYIFERPTMAAIPDESNVAMISVFLLLIVLIALSGIVYKLELHKKLFRSSYDTVAGG
uniref:Activin_recp domain-containing protein n=1 Tax=Panagrellus redivivus TaxID=6233 RepID=A0A7E4W0D4_PANRE